MTAAQIVRAVMVLFWLGVGLSHALQSRGWVRFFQRLHAAGKRGNLVNALLTLAPGVLIVVFHNVWRGLPTLMTVIGWLYLLKSAVYLLRPSLGLRSIGSVREGDESKLVIAGAIMIAIAALMAWTLVDELWPRQGSM